MTHQNLTRQRQTDLFLVHLLPKAELLNGELFYSLAEARIVIESWRQHYNTLRPHSSLGYKPPAPAAISWPAALPSTMAAKPTMH
jgi:transposase InsO family protein